MRVLICTSHFDSRDFFVATAPPLGLYRLQYALNQCSIDCDILDLSLSADQLPQYEKKITAGDYDIIGISVTHHNMTSDLDLLWRFRHASQKSDHYCLFIAGGQEATLNSNQWLDAGIDIIFKGYAEEVFAQFCKDYDQLSSPDKWQQHMATSYAGVAYREQSGRLYETHACSLDDAAFNIWSADILMKMDIPFDSYWGKLEKATAALNVYHNKFISRLVRLYTSSHCSMTCGYCSSRSFVKSSQGKNQPVIALNADKTYELIDYFCNQKGAKGFLFSDDDFIGCSSSRRQRIMDICERISHAKGSGKLSNDIIFNCQARVDDFLNHKTKHVYDDLIISMARAGFHSIGLGVETFPAHLLKAPSIHKAIYTEDDVFSVINALIDQHIVPTVNIILLIPESSVDDILYTIKCAFSCLKKGAQIAVTPFMDAFPGSTIYEDSTYERTFKTWIHPETGEVYHISDRFLPFDACLRDIMPAWPDQILKEMSRLKSDNNWAYDMLPKPITGLAIFIAILRLLKKNDLMSELNDYAKMIFSDAKKESL